MKKLIDYTLVISEHATMNERRAASFLQQQLCLICGRKLPMVSDSLPPSENELVIGKTNRESADALQVRRSPDRLWEYEIRTVGSRTYLLGLGEAESAESAYRSAYRRINDGAYGTVFAAYHFVEEILQYPFVFSTYEEFPQNPDVRIPNGYSFAYTKEALRAHLPKRLAGAAFYSVPSSEVLDWNMGCSILKTESGKLVVIDGGHEADAEHIVSVLETIASPQKPVVAAWMLTHLHEDHYGVYKRLCEDMSLASRIQVEHFYCHLLPREFYTVLSKEANPANGQVLDVLLGSYTSVGAELHTVQTGNIIRVDEMEFQVLHTPDMKDAADMNMNDSSVIFRLNYRNLQSILFLADAEWICSNALTALPASQLASDAVVVGHHGCGNVSLECYRRIGADIYLWQTGNRFWYGDNGEGLNTHNTGVIRTRSYIKELGARQENIYRDANEILSLPLPIPRR